MGSETILMSPLLIIGIFSIIVLMLDAFFKNKKALVFWTSIVSLILTGAAAAYVLINQECWINSINFADSYTRGMINFGGYSPYFDIIFCLAGIMTLFASRSYIQREYKEYNEFYALMLFAITGTMLIGHAGNLLTLFIGIELMSIPFYILSGYFRNAIKSVEAALKYFLLGAFATGFLAYGMAMIYGAAGSLDLTVITMTVSNGTAQPVYLLIGLGLLIVGLCFKVAAFPFHQWAPDVYTGAPTVVTAFMSTAGKGAALIAFIIIARALVVPSLAETQVQEGMQLAQIMIAVISAATMLIGNITALVQKNVKRMLAYSSVAHAGYLLMGITANTERGWSGIVFYITAYIFMQIGAFIVVSILERQDENMEFSDYSGLGKTHPALAALMAIFMVSLAGIPPFAGFFGKYYLFTAAMEAGFTWLTIIAVISSIISVYFYIGLIVFMYFKDPGENEISVKTGLAGLTLFISTAGVILLGIFPSFLIDLAKTLF